MSVFFSMIFQACGFGAVKILNWLSKCGCVAAIRFGYLVQELLMFIEDTRAHLAILVPWLINLEASLQL